MVMISRWVTIEVDTDDPELMGQFAEMSLAHRRDWLLAYCRSATDAAECAKLFDAINGYNIPCGWADEELDLMLKPLAEKLVALAGTSGKFDESFEFETDNLPPKTRTILVRYLMKHGGWDLDLNEPAEMDVFVALPLADQLALMRDPKRTVSDLEPVWNENLGYHPLLGSEVIGAAGVVVAKRGSLRNVNELIEQILHRDSDPETEVVVPVVAALADRYEREKLKELNEEQSFVSLLILCAQFKCLEEFRGLWKKCKAIPIGGSPGQVYLAGFFEEMVMLWKDHGEPEIVADISEFILTLPKL